MKKSILLLALLIPYNACAIDTIGIVFIALGSACGVCIGAETSMRYGHCSTCARYRYGCDQGCKECVGDCVERFCECCQQENFPTGRSNKTPLLMQSQPVGQPPVHAPLIVRPTPVGAKQLGLAEELKTLKKLEDLPK